MFRPLETIFQAEEGSVQAENEHRRIPDGFEQTPLEGLRAEARQSLRRFRPRTFGQASRLEGITPADLTLLSVLVKRYGATVRR